MTSAARTRAKSQSALGEMEFTNMNLEDKRPPTISSIERGQLLPAFGLRMQSAAIRNFFATQTRDSVKLEEILAGSSLFQDRNPIPRLRNSF
jgi:hypothetical protein